MLSLLHPNTPCFPHLASVTSSFQTCAGLSFLGSPDSVWLLINLTPAFSFLAGPSRPRRKGITKEDREMARLLHRTHLLCLLSRGLLYDEAANDPLLQVSPKPACMLIVYMTQCATDAVRHIEYVSHTHTCMHARTHARTHAHLCETCVKACMMSYMCVVYT